MNQSKKKELETAQFLEHLTSFLAEGGRSQEEIEESLKMQGIDPKSALSSFHQMLIQHATTWQERAERERRRALDRLQERQSYDRLNRDELKREITSVIASIQRRGGTMSVGAYHRKFETATDDDLRSMLEDLQVQSELLGGERE
jgi:hypothetical protein